jgi:tetratricopeptide (TPR) repeat protein
MLRFPTRPDLLAWLGALSLGALAAHWLAGGFAIQWWPQFRIDGSPSGVFSLVLALALELVLAMFALKLAVEALLDTAHGRDEPAGGESMPAPDGQALRQLFLLLGTVLLVYVAGRVGGMGALVLAALLAFAVLPAAIMLLAEDDSLAGALHPGAWLEVLRRLGGDYVRGAAGMAALVLAAIALQWLLGTQLPAWLATPAQRFVALYALLAGYHGLGAVMHARHAALGLDIASAATAPMLAAEADCLREAETLLSDDKPAEAIACIARLLRGRGASAPLHARYRELLEAAGDREGLLAHGRDYIAVLLALGKPAQAIALLRESLARDPAFEVAEPEELSRLIAAADAGGQSQLAVSLAEQFLRRFRRDRDRQANGLVAARSMCGRLGREADAIALLEALLREAPDHALAPALQQARDAIVLPPGHQR